ncbi:helix-turn-helix transcriptional regulator [Niabella beijingensis]|uniref:helix-turn-helix transcriptional regulator n=1 Tax=Niabella beijingensis TaxID=2872700 RepID=UPI001CBEBA7A|nr:helix-turn-helix transcriptional regulator [Niabella beijingensis]MBZ4192440.1 helix-turn-helix domain-containing protein [Niabella beijingensis]
MTDEQIIQEYKIVFRKYVKDGIIDLDKRLKHKFDFQIHALGPLIKVLDGIVPPYKQKRYAITYIEKAEGIKSIGHFTFPFENNLLLIIPKNLIHSSNYSNLNCSGYMLMFNVDFFLDNAFPKKHIEKKLIFKRSIKPWLKLSAQQAEKVKSILQQIHIEKDSQHKNKLELIAVKILELLVQCDRYVTDANNINETDSFNLTLEKFYDLVDQHHSKNRSVSYYARLLHLHPNYLNAIVNKHSGLSAKELIDDKILQEARYLLRATTFSVKELAFHLGFENAGYFSSFFRKRSGSSPIEFRRSVL